MREGVECFGIIERYEMDMGMNSEEICDGL